MSNLVNAKRSVIPIAIFNSNGYAHGWRFAVPKVFAPALDIRFDYRKLNGKAYPVITQGTEFAFRTGDTFYDSVMPRTPGMQFGFALQFVSFMIRVESATPAFRNELSNGDGQVVFSMWRAIGSELVPFMSFKTTQVEFVRFLQQGKMVAMDGQVDIDSLWVKGRVVPVSATRGVS